MTDRSIEGRPRSRRRSAAANRDRNFWSFRPLSAPQPPPVRDQAWVRTPIDRFMLGALEHRGLEPESDRRSPHAHPPGFLRPDRIAAVPEEIAAFVADPGARCV